MTYTETTADGLPAIACQGRIRTPRNAERCQHPHCKRHAQYLCMKCDALVCSRHGTAVSTDESCCNDCAPTSGAAGVQRELFKSVRPRGRRPALDGLDQQRG